MHCFLGSIYDWLCKRNLETILTIEWVQYIGFSGDRIDQTFYELGRVLKREGII
jgi:hypothetical protein